MLPGSIAATARICRVLGVTEIRWEEIGLGDVAPVIELTKELIGAHLG